MVSRFRIVITGVVLVVLAILAVVNNLRKTEEGPKAPLKWKYAVGKPWLATPALATDGTVFVSSETGLTALNPDGTEKWKFPAYHVIGSPTVAGDGVIYFIADAGLFAVNPNGTAMWQNPQRLSGYHGFFSPVVDRAGVVYVNASGGIAALRSASGDRIWTTTDLTVCDTCAAVVGRDGNLIFAMRNRGIAAVGPDGETRWRSESTDGDLGAPAVMPNGTIVVGTTTHGVFLANTDGSQVWAFPTRAAVKGAVIDREGNIYFGAEDGTFYSLTSDGRQRWEFGAGAGISKIPALASDGTIYISAGRLFYALRPDGSVKWKFDAADVISSNPTISPDGAVYVVDTLGTLYAFEEKNGGLMDSSWPKYKHDAANTGVAR